MIMIGKFYDTWIGMHQGFDRFVKRFSRVVTKVDRNNMTVHIGERVIHFRCFCKDSDKWDIAGMQFSWVEFDEASHFPEDVVNYTLSRIRGRLE